jgi:hypothetical protein
MGRNTKRQSNQSLAHPHAKGTAVTVIQMLAHAQFGTICDQSKRQPREEH